VSNAVKVTAAIAKPVKERTRFTGGGATQVPKRPTTTAVATTTKPATTPTTTNATKPATAIAKSSAAAAAAAAVASNGSASAGGKPSPSTARKAGFSIRPAKTDAEMSEMEQANVKKRADIETRSQKAAELRLKKGEQAKLKAEAEAAEKKASRDAERKRRMNALKTGKKLEAPPTRTTPTQFEKTAESSRGTDRDATTPASTTSSAKVRSTTSSTRPSSRTTPTLSSSQRTTPSKLPTPNTTSRHTTRTTHSRTSDQSTSGSNASRLPVTAADKDRSTTSAPTTKQSTSTSTTSTTSAPTKHLSTEMQSLEDEYMRIMQGMTGGGGDSDAIAEDEPQHKEFNEIDDAPKAKSIVFDCGDGTEISARQRTVVRQPKKGFGVIVHSAKHSTWIKVQKVTADGPFDAAGVTAGDVFVAVNGTSVVGRSHGFLKKLLVGAPDSFEVVMSTELELPKTRKLLSGVITRRPGTGGLGLVLYADPFSVSHGCVHKVEQGGPCDLAGIQEGDVFVEVNGDNVEDVSHKDLVSVFANCSDEIPFVVEIGGATNELPGDVAELPAGLEPRVVTIEREEGESLGVVLYSDKEHRGVQLQLVSPSGPFGRAGVSSGEIIVEVDGYGLLDVTHAEVHETLKLTGKQFDVALVPAEAFTKESSKTGTTSGLSSTASRKIAAAAAAVVAAAPGAPTEPNGLEEMRTVNVVRIPGKGLGIELKSSKTLVGTRAHNLNIAGPMAFAGVNEGDVFVHVNGVPVLNASHKDVIKAFHTAGPEFTVVVIPAEVLDGPLSPVKQQPVKKPFEEAWQDDMGKSKEISKKTRSGAVGGGSALGTTDMRSWDSTLERERNMLFARTSDSMELSQGYLALKKAQKEAQSLQEATKHYEHLFEQQLRGAAFGKKDPLASSSGSVGARVAATNSPLKAGRGQSSSVSPPRTTTTGTADGTVVPEDSQVSWQAFDGQQQAFDAAAAGGTPTKTISRSLVPNQAATPPRRRFLNL
jgi:S1-C subfamily serine protease